MLKYQTKKKISNGNFYPLGATVNPDGVNFAIFSKHAKEVFLLLFNRVEAPPTDSIQLKCFTKNIWHGLVHGLKPGQLYAYKIRGSYDPAHGLRFNENKLLIDPYAKALTGQVSNKDNLLLAYDPKSASRDLTLDPRDNTGLVPKCIVIEDNAFDWQNDQGPNLALDDTIIYEVHVKGFTAHPTAGVKHPGTYLGFIEKIPYLKSLGITAVELLPVHQFVPDDVLLQKKLTNYWGYNTLCYFAPEMSYSTQKSPGCQVNEFKTLVRELHKAGIEVILDVVFNHTCEGNQLGPTLSFRGIDNPSYYCLTGPANEPARYYADYSGCGNSLDASNEVVLRLIMDSLRYWVETMHVDGFRFDLASVLGRSAGNFQDTAAFFEAVAQDPILCRTKLIAEPWDIRTYQLGHFPVDFAEWNGQFRDTVRKFIKGDNGQAEQFCKRIAGSPDIYAGNGKTVHNSLNFITCHDGFTLNDLVSYSQKHNEKNGENNADGSSDNNSWNWGAEGNTADPKIIQLRKQLIKNFCSALFLAAGTPMLLGGDEFCRTQHGNNNAYCQDNAISWFNWELLETNQDIFAFIQKAIHMRKNYRIFRKQHLPYGTIQPPTLSWYTANLNPVDWGRADNHTVCSLVHASEPGSNQMDFFAIFNSDHVVQKVKLPALKSRRHWHRIIDTALNSPDDFVGLKEKGVVIDPPDFYLSNPRSVVLLVSQ
ncbi:MAG: glycogen debranching protein GlgX [Candidatus Margulisiibacteriota bacterium]